MDITEACTIISLRSRSTAPIRKKAATHHATLSTFSSLHIQQLEKFCTGETHPAVKAPEPVELFHTKRTAAPPEGTRAWRLQ
jgi:hypothetical protein